MKKYLFLIFCCVSALLFAQEAKPAENEAETKAEAEKAPARPAGRQRPQMQAVMIERLRENAAALLKRYDADGDGKLNEEEKAALEKEMQLVEELFPLSVAYKRLKIVDKDGDFVINDEEAAAIDMSALREQAGGFRGGERTPRGEGRQGARQGRQGGGAQGAAPARQGRQGRQGRGNRNQ